MIEARAEWYDDLAVSAKQEASLGQIREVLPGYGDGFLVACLDAMGQSTELVIHQLLEGSLPGSFPTAVQSLASCIEGRIVIDYEHTYR